jgi:hypothetical protein
MRPPNSQPIIDGVRTATITTRLHGWQRAPVHVVAAPAGGRGDAIVDLPLTVRRATAADEGAVARLAALDSAEIPSGPLLLAESNGELRAALSLTDGQTIADPFHATAAITDLLASVISMGPPRPAGLRRLGRSRRRP